MEETIPTARVVATLHQIWQVHCNQTHAALVAGRQLRKSPRCATCAAFMDAIRTARAWGGPEDVVSPLPSSLRVCAD
jgi:hypothetical protein